LFFYTIYHTQAYTLPLPLNPINHQAIYYWYLHSYTPFCGMCAMCVNVLCLIFTQHYNDSYLLSVTVLYWLCACCFTCRSYSCMDCLFSFHARPYSCNGVWISHWM